MAPSQEREHSLLGEHCSAVRLSGGIDLVCLEGLDRHSMAEHTPASGRTSDFAGTDRPDAGRCHTGNATSKISSMLVPSGLFAICNRDRCNLNYSFFELRLCP